MSSDDAPSEERLAQMIALLGPVPEHALTAAMALPQTLRALAEIDKRVLEGAADREQQTAELAAALERAGAEPTPERVQALERALRAIADES